MATKTNRLGETRMMESFSLTIQTHQVCLKMIQT